MLFVKTDLQLYFSTDASHSLFNCVSLEKLVLSIFCFITVPTIYVCFGHLELLKLCGIVFSIDASSDCLTLSLPVLKKFETRHCVWLSAEGVTIKAPLVESVFIEQDTFVPNRVSISVPNELRRCSIKFSDCHLREFTYRGDGISHPLILSNPSSAHNASVDIHLDKYYDSEGMIPAPRFYSFMLLNQLSQAKSVKVGGDMEIFNINNLDAELLNSTAKPHCLVSSLQDVKFEHSNGRKEELIIAKFLIENGMVLQMVTLTQPKSKFTRRKSKVTQRNSKVMKEFKELFSLKKASPSLVLNFHD